MIEGCLARLDVQQQEGLRMLGDLLNQQSQIQAQLQEFQNVQAQQNTQQQQQHAFAHLPLSKRIKLANSESSSNLLDPNSSSSSSSNLTSTTTTATTSSLLSGNPLANSLSSSSSGMLVIGTGTENTPGTVSGNGNGNGNRPGDTGKSDFEGSFSSMLRSYSLMNAEEKAERVRKILRSLTQRDVEQLEELFDIMSTVGVKTSGSGIIGSFIGLGGGTGIPGSGVPGSGAGGLDFTHSDACNEDCPHKMELSNIYQFYSEAFL